jgi:hypothetical protein
VNAYRSGDYVGRFLWRSDGCAYLYRGPAAPSPATALWTNGLPHPGYVSHDADLSRRELCLGTGAHTHYFDDTAREVAVMLDTLIVEACLEM